MALLAIEIAPGDGAREPPVRPLARMLREAASGGIAALLGRDRLALLAPYDTRDPDTVRALADHLAARLAQPFEVDGESVRIVAAIGIARADGTTPAVDALVRRAAIAARHARSVGGRRVAAFDAGMEAALARRGALERALRDGIAAGRFVPGYQPQVAISGGGLIGFDVVPRRAGDDGALAAIDELVGIAEETGLVADLAAAVMRRALLEARDWDPSLTLSFAVSPVQLADPWLAQKIVKLLVETGFPAERLEIAIPEAALADDLALARTTIGSLRNQGVRLALDDIGAPRSALAGLRAMPFGRVRIDPALVADEGAAAVIAAIGRLGEGLSLTVAAKGIADADAADRLAALGCADGQGTLYGGAMAVAAARRLLAERGLLPAARMSLRALAPPPARRAG